MENVIFELSVILITTATLCTLAEITKQPLIPAYILAGLILGKSGIGIISSDIFFTSIAEVGIILLLYLIGLELKPRYFVKTFSRTSIIALASLAVNIIIGVLLYYTTPLTAIKSFYFMTALFFSSTVAVMRTLMETKAIGKNVYDGCLGILLMQDLIAILVLVILNSQQLTGHFEFFGIVQFIFYGISVIFLSWFLQKWLLRVVIRKLIPNSDVIFLIGLAWCFFFAELAEVLQLSREIGAFIAGLSITSLPHHKQKIFVDKSSTIRDFFMVLFFFMLGANFHISEWAAVAPLIVLGIILTVAVKPLTLYYLSKLMSYTEHQSREIGLRMGQISEFSIIVVAFGIQLQHIDSQFINAIHLIFFISIIISGYLVKYALPKWATVTEES